MNDLIKRLRLGASISRERGINLDFAKIAEEAADALEARQTNTPGESMSNQIESSTERAAFEAKPAPEPVTWAFQESLPDAMKVVIGALRADPDYAWSWHCNITMSMVDEGIDHAAAEHGAQRFLNLLCGPGPMLVPAHPLRDRVQAKPVNSSDAMHELVQRSQAALWMSYLDEKAEVEQLREELDALKASAPAAPAQVPLTDERLRQMHHEDEFGLYCDDDDFLDIARSVESECARAWGVKLAASKGGAA